MLGMQRMTTRDGTIVFHDPPIAQLLFGNTRLAWLWTIVRVYVGWSWLEAGLHKVFKYDAATNTIFWGQINEGWMVTGASILGYWKGAVAIPAAPARPAITFDWFRVFLQFLIDSQAQVWMGRVIAIGEVLVGLGLIAGALVGIAAFFGAFMNMNFLLAGTTSSNPVLFLLAVLLMLAWKTAGYYGLDRYLLPLLGTPWQTLRMSTAPPAPMAGD